MNTFDLSKTFVGLAIASYITQHWHNIFVKKYGAGGEYMAQAVVFLSCDFLGCHR
jgi:hypothetical protein